MIRYYAGDMLTLQKAISCDLRDELKGKGKMNLGNRSSFAHEVTNQHREFGDCVITVDRTKICKRYKCIDVHYSLDFMKTHPHICGIVTGYSPKELVENTKETYATSPDGFHGSKEDLEYLTSQDLEFLYGWEDEVVVKGNPIIITKDDVISINSFPSW